MNSKIYRRTIFLCCSIAFLLGVLTQYVENYYRVDLAAMDAFNSIDVETRELDGMSIYGDTDSKFGIIFYPGAKVEYKAYEPLMKKLASKGFFCVAIEMPYNLPFFGIDAADGIQNKYPLVDKWYMMGHSLGGVMAGTYLVEHYKSYEGLILLASYVTDSLVHTDLDVISVYGTEDKILNMHSYEKNKINYPEDFIEMKIHGGNHAYFGVYGFQKGDGQATITNEQQMQQTVDVLKVLIMK